MKVLVVDDEKNMRQSISEYLALEHIEAKEAENGLCAQRLLSEEAFDLLITDLKMPGMSGLDLLAWMRESGPSVPVIMMSAFGDVRDAVQAMKLGAKDYLVKPFDPEELIMRIRRIAEENRLKRHTAAPRTDSRCAEEWIGESPSMKAVRRLVEKVAPSDSTVLVTGESGTGKEVVARTVHCMSPRAEGPFIPINIGGIPDTLLESELFGYEKGAFTGADQRKTGMFELASSGTLFLDEIGDMPIHLQVKLLRVIQDRKIQRLGGTKPIPIDVRIIAATNKTIEALVKEGKFREDLFYRLNVIRIELPPLRERPEDIPALAVHFIEKLNPMIKRTVSGISQEALASLKSYGFPGNVRELENLIERAMILTESDMLEARDFSIAPTQQRAAPKTGTVKELERRAIEEALARWEGNRTKAAAELGMNRRTLFNKMKEYGIG